MEIEKKMFTSRRNRGSWLTCLDALSRYDTHVCRHRCLRVRMSDVCKCTASQSPATVCHDFPNCSSIRPRHGSNQIQSVCFRCWTNSNRIVTTTNFLFIHHFFLLYIKWRKKIKLVGTKANVYLGFQYVSQHLLSPFALLVHVHNIGVFFFVCVYFVLVKSKEEFACHLCITKGLDPSQANIISGIPNATTAVYKTTAISVMPQHTRTNAPQSRQHTYIRIYIEYGSGMTRASCSTRKIWSNTSLLNLHLNHSRSEFHSNMNLLTELIMTQKMWLCACFWAASQCISCTTSDTFAFRKCSHCSNQYTSDWRLKSLLSCYMINSPLFSGCRYQNWIILPCLSHRKTLTSHCPLITAAGLCSCKYL